MLKLHRLFVFNPDNEMAIANGNPYYTPPAAILKMAEDLAYLPAYYADKGDAVWVKELPDKNFIENMQACFRLPALLITEKHWNELEIDEFCPWGWSPRMYFLLQKWQVGKWEEKRKELYSRRTAAECLRKLSLKLDFVEKETLPAICHTLQDVEKTTKGGGFLIKAPWSSSGRGLLKIGEKGITPKSSEWLGGILKKQGYVMVEKEQDRLMDFAMEFYASRGTVEFIGLSCFVTGNTGEYTGNFVGNQESMEKRLTVWMGKEKLEQLKTELIQILTEEIAGKYNGYFGVDMMIYRTPARKIGIQPCLEINLRYTMGILALFLHKRLVAEKSEGFFSIIHHTSDGEALRFHQTASQKFPLRIREHRLIEGHITLTPVTQDTRFSAYLHIRKNDYSCV